MSQQIELPHMSPANGNARMKKLRDDRLAKGFKRFEVWLPPDFVGDLDLLRSAGIIGSITDLVVNELQAGAPASMKVARRLAEASGAPRPRLPQAYRRPLA